MNRAIAFFQQQRRNLTAVYVRVRFMG